MSAPITAAGLGPIQLKKATEALKDLHREQDKSDEITESGFAMTRAVFHLNGRESQSNPEAARLYRELVERWRPVPLTPKNLKAFMAEVADATAKAVAARPCIDRREKNPTVVPPFDGYHLGDPCVYCRVPHDEVAAGACPGVPLVHVTRSGIGGVYGHPVTRCDAGGCAAGTELYYAGLVPSQWKEGDVAELPEAAR